VSALLQFPNVVSASKLADDRATTPAWRISDLAGRIVELSGDASSPILTLATGLVYQAQVAEEPAAWIATPDRLFYPPDVARAGVDLDALAIVRVGNALAAPRAADKLIRSGAFGLVIMDLGDAARVPTPLLSRLVGLAAKHDTAVVFLTDKSSHDPSLGSLVSLRAIAVRTKRTGGRFECVAEVLKDKRRGPGWRHTEIFVGPAGLTRTR